MSHFSLEWVWLKLDVFARLELFGDVIKPQHELFGFLFAGIRSKGEQTVGDVALDARGGQPAAEIELFFPGSNELAENGDVATEYCRVVADLRRLIQR